LKKDFLQTAIVTTVKHEKPHNGIAHERFRAPGPFAILPLVGNYSSLVWVEKNKTVEYLLNLSDKDFQNELQKRFGNFLGNIETVTPKLKYNLKLFHAKKYFDNRLILIGDAAHTIHPLAGQNLNLTIQDITSLVIMLKKKYMLGLDLGSINILSEFDKLRRPNNDRLIFMTTFLNSLFSTEDSLRKISRRLGISLVDKIKPAKIFFMNYAGGKGEEIPNFSDINTYL
jgi:2-polyprenyl-6-methoxyphenol hydroxylase and related FAD-dependent oxidoreductases